MNFRKHKSEIANDQKSKCMMEGCLRKKKIRGLCDACHASARKLIKIGRTTDAELVRMGLMLPKIPPSGRPRKYLSNALMLAFEKAKSDQSETKEGGS